MKKIWLHDQQDRISPVTCIWHLREMLFFNAKDDCFRTNNCTISQMSSCTVHCWSFCLHSSFLAFYLRKIPVFYAYRICTAVFQIWIPRDPVLWRSRKGDLCVTYSIINNADVLCVRYIGMGRLHIDPWTKWPSVCRRLFKGFFEMKLFFNCDWNCIEPCSIVTISQQWIRLWASSVFIIRAPCHSWTNVDRDIWRYMTSVGYNKLTDCRRW